MKGKWFHRPSMALLLCLSLLAPLPGVSALWSYANGRADPVQAYCALALMPFEYPPSDVLPTDSGRGEDHLDVVDSLVNKPLGGLNGFLFNSIIPNNLDKYGGVLYSRQTVTIVGIPAKNLLEAYASTASGNVYFVIESISASEMAVYTFSKTDIDNGGAGDAVSGYRTVVKKDGGSWTAAGSKKGYILLKTVTVGGGESFLSFDPRNGEWKDGEIPTE